MYFKVKVQAKFKSTPLKNPLESLAFWDHAQMIERKILFRIALTRALYDQIRPHIFQKYCSNFDPPVQPKTTPKTHPLEGVGCLLAAKKKIPIGPIFISFFREQD